MHNLTLLILAINIAIITGNIQNIASSDGVTPDPGTIKIFNGTYYLVSTTIKNKNRPEKFAIYTSTDLVSWTPSGHIFNSTNLPSWTNREKEFWVPEIHKFGDKYNVFFASRDVGGTNRMAIGVAVAAHPLGPYSSTDWPIFSNPNADVLDSTIINNNGTSYFVWKSGNTFKARALNTAGTGFSSDQVTNLYTNNQPWKNITVEGGPWYVKRGEYHYLLYSGQKNCSEQYEIGAARSLSPLGPYEKRKDPSLSTNSDPKSSESTITVKDLDDKFDLLFFHAFKKDKVCGPWPRVTLLVSLSLEGAQSS